MVLKPTNENVQVCQKSTLCIYETKIRNGYINIIVFMSVLISAIIARYCYYCYQKV